MVKRPEQDFRGLIAILLIMFGGVTGLGVLIMLSVQKNLYDNGASPIQSLAVKNTVAVAVAVFITNMVISSFGNQAPYSSLYFLGFPFGMLLAKTLLIDQNIHLMNKDFWKSLDLKSADLSTLIANSSTSQSKKTSVSSQKYASQSTKNSSENQAITINNQGDGTRVALILVAFISLIVFLGTHYLLDNTDMVQQKLEDVMVKTGILDGQ